MSEILVTAYTDRVSKKPMAMITRVDREAKTVDELLPDGTWRRASLYEPVEGGFKLSNATVRTEA